MYKGKTLKVFGTGQITLPKEIREKYGVLNFKLSEVKKGILLEPIVIREELIFTPPISAKQFSKEIKKSIKKLDGK